LLVAAGLCPASSPDVTELRRLTWPLKNASAAPRIDKIVYINLAWDQVRKMYMEQQMQMLSSIAWKTSGKRLSWERLEAVNATRMQMDVTLGSWRQKGFSPAKSPNVQGDWATAACAFSHYAAIRQVPQLDDGGLIIIAEDDVEFDPNFLQLWEQVWPYIPPKWDVLRVGWFSDHQNCSQSVNAKVDRAGWQDPHNGECAYCGAQAYIVNPASKARVLQRFERSKMTHADELLGAPTPQLEDEASVPPLLVYVVYPMLANMATRTGTEDVAFRSDRVEGLDAIASRRKLRSKSERALKVSK